MMNQRIARSLSLVLGALASASLYAADGSITVSPAVVQLTGSFGQSTTQPLTITNGTSGPLTFEMIAEDVVVRDGKRVFVPSGEVAASIAATAVFSRRLITVMPGSSQSVDATLTIPIEAKSRAVAVIFHGKTRELQGSVGVVASIGTLLTFTVSDVVNVATEPVQVRAQTALTNLRVAQWCVNSGSDPVIARGVGAILDGHGALAGKIILEPQRLLPGERLEMSGEYGGELAAGRYGLLITYDLDGRKSLSVLSATEVK
jgi:hypothetical protein